MPALVASADRPQAAPRCVLSTYSQTPNSLVIDISPPSFYSSSSPPPVYASQSFNNIVAHHSARMMSATQGTCAPAAICRLTAPPRVHAVSPLTLPPLLPSLSIRPACFSEQSFTRSTVARALEPSEDDDHSDHVSAPGWGSLSLSSPKSGCAGWALKFILSLAGSTVQAHTPQPPTSPAPPALRILPRLKSRRARGVAESSTYLRRAIDNRYRYTYSRSLGELLYNHHPVTRTTPRLSLHSKFRPDPVSAGAETPSGTSPPARNIVLSTAATGLDVLRASIVVVEEKASHSMCKLAQQALGVVCRPSEAQEASGNLQERPKSRKRCCDEVSGLSVKKQKCRR